LIVWNESKASVNVMPRFESATPSSSGFIDHAFVDQGYTHLSEVRYEIILWSLSLDGLNWLEYLRYGFGIVSDNGRRATIKVCITLVARLSLRVRLLA
jgi:hypothetical protein